MRPSRFSVKCHALRHVVESLENRLMLAGAPPTAMDDAFRATEDQILNIDNQLRENIEIFSVPQGDPHRVAYDDIGKMFYVSIPELSLVVPIDSLTGETGDPLSIPGSPDELVVTDDGQYLYVGADAAGTVVRVDLASRTIDQTIALGDRKYAEDIEILPGEPESIAVVISTKGVSPRLDRVVIYDDGVARPVTGWGVNTIEVSTDGTRIYGYVNSLSSRDVHLSEIKEDGIHQIKTLSYAVGLGRMEFMNERLYFDEGTILDADLNKLGTLHRDHFVEMIPLPSGRVAGISGTERTIDIWDSDSQQRVDSMELKGRPSARAGIPVGDDGMAFVAGQLLYWVRSDRLTGVVGRDVLVNDSDPEGESLIARLVSEPAHGEINLREDGTFDYTPARDYVGTDTFTYVANDGTKDSDPATVTITVQPVNDRPAATSDVYYIPESAVTFNTNASMGVLVNDTDPDDDALSVALVQPPQSGQVTLASDGSFLYQADESLAELDQFTYVAVDARLQSSPVTVTLVRSNSPETPVALDDEYAAVEDTALHVSVTGNEVGPPAMWTETVVPRGSVWSYLDDGTDPGTSWNQPSFNDREWAAGRAELGYGDGGEATTVSDGDPSNRNITTFFRHEFVLDQAHEVESLDVRIWRDDGVAAYLNGVEIARDNLPDDADYRTPATDIADDDGNVAIPFLNLDPSLLRPGTNVLAVELHQESSRSIDISFDLELSVDRVGTRGVLANDFVETELPLSAVLVDDVQHGLLSLRGDGTFQYEPAQDYVGSDSFTYLVTDGSRQSRIATVKLAVGSVDDSPIGVDDLQYVVDEDTSLSVVAEDGVLANDIEKDDETLTAQLTRRPNHGDVTLLPDGAFDYVPNQDFFGDDTFEYQAFDRKGSTTPTTVRIRVRPLDDLPVAADDHFELAEDGILDVDSTPRLTVESMDLTVGDIAEDPLSGNLWLSVNSPGHELDDSLVAFDPYLGTTGESIELLDSMGQIAVSRDGASIHVVGDSGRTVLFLDLEDMQVGDPVNMPGAGRDATVVDSFLSYGPRDGSVLISVRDGQGRSKGAFLLEGNGGVPEDLVLGPNILAIEEESDRVFGYENWLSSFDFHFMEVTEAGLVQTDVLRYSAVLSGFNISKFYANGNLLYTNRGEAYDYVRSIDVGSFAGGENFIVDTHERRLYSLADEQVGHMLRIYDMDSLAVVGEQRLDSIDGKTFALTRFGKHGLAFATDAGQVFAVQSDELFGVTDAGVLHNDYDVDRDSLTAELVSDVSHGTLTLNEDGTFRYIPNADYSGTDQFQYRVLTNEGASEPATVVLTILEENDVPVAQPDTIVMPMDASQLVVDAAEGVLANDVDKDLDPLIVELSDSPEHGTVELAADGGFVYTPGVGFVLSDQFSYVASDGLATSDPTIVRIELDVPRVSVGDFQLRPNTPNQQVPIYVEGTTLVSGLNLYAQVGDGGPELGDYGEPAGTDGPTIASVDMKTGTIFASIDDHQIDQPGIPQVAISTIAIAADEERVEPDGVLATLTIDTTGFFEGSWPLLLSDVLPFASLSGPFRSDFAGIPMHIDNGSLTIQETRVVGRHLIYGQSSFGDELVTDKQALLPGNAATFANYTSYTRGINGIVIDVANTLTPPSIDDLSFRVGRSNDISSWGPAPQPISFSMESGGGADGADRILVRWNEGEIINEWLEVTVHANEATGLVADDRFYYGNAPGDTGDTTSNAIVNATDVVTTRDNKRGPFDQADITNPYDFNRDRLVNATDVIFARDHATSPFNALPLLNIPEHLIEASQEVPAVAAISLVDVAIALESAAEQARSEIGESGATNGPSADWSKLKARARALAWF